MMNSLGDFPPLGQLGSVPYHQPYSPQFYPTAGSNNSYPCSLPMPSPSLNTKPKSTIGYYNGYPIASTAASTPTTPSKILPGDGSSSGYSTSLSNASPSSFGPVLKPQTQPRPRPPQWNATIRGDGTVANLPQSMLTDQYGLAALVVGVKAANHLGALPDYLCTEVMREMNVPAGSNEPLYKSFAGPLTVPSEPESVSTVSQGVTICPEYLVAQRLVYESPEVDVMYMRKTWALKIDEFSEDLLFYVFYTFTRDILQVVAASNLYNKGWRYHIEAKLWLHRLENGVYVKENGREKGIYNYFDYVTWKPVQIEICVDHRQLEGPPTIPPDFFASTHEKSGNQFDSK